jgi:hypothetical protein
MSYLMKMFVALVSVLVMSGCALHQYADSTDLSAYPYRHAAFDYKYVWKTVKTEQGISIEGLMKNVRYAYINSVLMKVELLGKDDQVMSMTSGFPVPQETRMGEVNHFSLLLTDAKPVSGDMFRFTVHYTGNDGDSDDKVDWISIFTVDALTGAVIHPPDKKAGEW